MKIMCMNCQNNKTNKHGGIEENGFDNAKLLADYIIANDISLVGTQEMSVNFTNNLRHYLPNFKLPGKYRNDFPILSKLFPKLNEYKENNKIITKYKVKKEYTLRLPWFPFKYKEIKYGLKRKSIMKRIASGALVETEYGLVYMMNTHLDYAIEAIQVKQLEKIYKHLKNMSKKYPIILSGDFNLEYKNKIFADFIKNMETINVKRIEINDKTNGMKHKNETAIDHIFVSKCFDIEDYGVIGNEYLLNMTDHKPIFVEINKIM